ncbi:HEPN domain-containing protein [candidate division KSB1 bacterium]|nr:HEPN domain-containing protein [candidate division KSB1 bacterium]RQW10496.1 MAG: HEPN domain-containing protein [candidate division KSB1 bacterium]
MIAYRMQQADDSLNEAHILHRERAYRGAINRAYYAMFYALLALLATKHLGSSKHSGVIALFDREFVKPGIFSKNMSKSIRIAFENRQDHDYGEFVELDDENSDEMIQMAERFITSIRDYLVKEGFMNTVDE